MTLKTFLTSAVAAIAATAACLTPVARAEEFTLIIYERDAELASRSDPAGAQAYWDGYNRFAAALAQAGVLRGGSALSETTSRTIDARGARDDVREVRGTRIGGYFVIDVASLDEAVRWARQAPGATTGSIEVRPHRANPTMTMSAATPPMPAAR